MWQMMKQGGGWVRNSVGDSGGELKNMRQSLSEILKNSVVVININIFHLMYFNLNSDFLIKKITEYECKAIFI